jgi:hypothetical protein
MKDWAPGQWCTYSCVVLVVVHVLKIVYMTDEGIAWISFSVRVIACECEVSSVISLPVEQKHGIKGDDKNKSSLVKFDAFFIHLDLWLFCKQY